MRIRKITSWPECQPRACLCEGGVSRTLNQRSPKHGLVGRPHLGPPGPSEHLLILEQTGTFNHCPEESKAHWPTFPWVLGRAQVTRTSGQAEHETRGGLWVEQALWGWTQDTEPA